MSETETDTPADGTPVLAGTLPIEPTGSDPGDETGDETEVLAGAGPEPMPIPPPDNRLLTLDAIQQGLYDAIQQVKYDARDRGAEFILESSELTQRLVEVAAWPVSQAKADKLNELEEQYRLLTLSAQLSLAESQQTAVRAVVNVAVKLANNSLLAVLA
jgi:hypothetical protein